MLTSKQGDYVSRVSLGWERGRRRTRRPPSEGSRPRGVSTAVAFAKALVLPSRWIKAAALWYVVRRPWKKRSRNKEQKGDTEASRTTCKSHVPRQDGNPGFCCCWNEVSSQNMPRSHAFA